MLRRKALLLRLLAWPPIFILILNGWFYLQQPRITFYPYAELETSPSEWGLIYEDVELTTMDQVRLHGWYLPYPGATRTLLFLHGNGGNISHRGESLAILHRLGLNVLIIDYRGYGRSGGEPSEEGLYLDAQAAWHYLTVQRGVAPQQVLIFGRSLGGAVATDLASRVRPAGLILDSTFSSAADMAAQLFPRLSQLIYLRYRFDSVAKVAQVRSPIIILHSTEDEVIPYPLGRRLYAAAAEPKRFYELRGDHNSGFLQSQPGYELALQGFIAGL